MKDERISQRVQTDLPAQFCFENEPESLHDATVINISTHGFCFRAEAKHYEKFNSNPVARLFFKISEKEKVQLDIQVVWTGKTSSVNCLTGGEILNPSQSDYQKILTFYTKLFRERIQ